MVQDTTPIQGEKSSKRPGARSRPTGHRAKLQPVFAARTVREDDSPPQRGEKAQGRPLQDFLMDDNEAATAWITKPVNPICKLEIYRLSRNPHLATVGSFANPSDPNPRMKRYMEKRRKRVGVEMTHANNADKATRQLTSEDRNKFDCGIYSLNRYFRLDVAEDVNIDYVSAYVAVEEGTDDVAGYYTISAGGLPLDEIHQDWEPEEPFDLPQMPAAKIDNLAVDRKFHGQGVEVFLIADAANRIKQAPVGVAMLAIVAADDTAASIYCQLGMRQLLRTPDKYHAPINVLVSSIGSP